MMYGSAMNLSSLGAGGGMEQRTRGGEPRRGAESEECRVGEGGAAAPRAQRGGGVRTMAGKAYAIVCHHIINQV